MDSGKFFLSPILVKLGYAVNEGKDNEGFNRVSTPAFDQNKSMVAALTVTEPVQKLPKHDFEDITTVIGVTAVVLVIGLYLANRQRRPVGFFGLICSLSGLVRLLRN
jgi:hypothetical protein